MSGALRLTFCVLRQAKTQIIDVNRLLTLPKVLPTVSIIQTKNSSFFNQGDANQVWGSLTGLSNTGKKRGRGRGIRKKINLNKGQEIGQGRAGMEWPGLTSSVYSGQEIVKMHKHGPRQEYFDNILQQKSAKTSFRSLKIPPILRGWTGSTMAGRSTHPPDPVGDYAFDGFEAKILEVKKVVNVSGTVKSVPRFSCMVVVGNKNGIGGFAVGKATKMFTALRKATNKAAQHLQYVPRFEKHTIYHNMYSEQTATKMFLYRKHEGYGVVAHRCIKSICDVIGVKNLYVKCEGSTKNVQNVTKAFFNALRNQETHQELADRLKLHVVEQRGENDFMPVVVASPSDGAVSKTPLPIEESNFETLYFDGKLQVMKRKRPFYIFHKTHKRALKARTMLKIQKAARRERILYDLEPPKTRRAKKTGD